MTAPFPKVQLPDWPAEPAFLPGGPPNKSHQAELALASLEALGFSLVMEGQYIPLEGRVRDMVDEATGARPRSPTSKHWKQWWSHPAGIVAIVDRYETISHGWRFNALCFMAEIRNPAGLTEKSGVRFDEAGEAFEMVLCSSGYERSWAQLLRAAQEGRLVPLDKWSSPGTKNASTIGSTLSIYDDLIKISRKLIYSNKDRSPLAISRLTDEILQQNIPLVSGLARKQIDALDVSEADRATWLRIVAGDVVRYATPQSLRSETDQSKLPGWVKKNSELSGLKAIRNSTHHASASTALQYAIKDLAPNSSVFLSEDERAITAHWLSVLSDRRHPRLQAPALHKAMALSIPRLGLSFHHLLFESIKLPGVPAKALWWQSQQADETLVEMCKVPDQDGKTLPMRWAEGWMLVPNEKVKPRRQRLRAAVAQYALEDLLGGASLEQFAWSTDNRSIWDNVVNPGFSVEMDDDLRAPHQVAVRGFLQWSLHKKIDLPSMVFFPGSLKPHNVIDPEDLGVGFSDWFTREEVFWSVQASVDSMTPVSAYLLNSRLSEATPPALGTRRPGTRL